MQKAAVLYFLNSFQKPGLLKKPFGFLFHCLQHSMLDSLAICLIFAYIEMIFFDAISSYLYQRDEQSQSHIPIN